MAEWVAAIAATALVFAAILGTYVSMRLDIKALQVQVNSMDRQLGINVRQVEHLEGLIVGLAAQRRPPSD